MGDSNQMVLKEGRGKRSVNGGRDDEGDVDVS